MCGASSHLGTNMISRRTAITVLIAVASVTYADATPEIELQRRDSTPPVALPGQNLTGTAWLHSQFRRAAPSRLAGVAVTFDTGARSSWHTHPHGQTLIVTAGVGYVQHWGGKRELMREGDIVWIPPGVKHWHGATESSSMTHVALVETLDGKTVDWLEKVSDQQYAGE
jgi:quercetin dioxygenase-like cupin family protein